MSHDVIVLGAGTNGLVAAHLLARAGRRVLVLEQQGEGANLTDLGWVHRGIIDDLGLTGQGLVVQAPDPWIAVPLADGGRLELYRESSRTAEALRRLSPRDAAAWPAFCERMHKLVQVLEQLYVHPAPDVETTDPGELMRLALFGLKVRGFGKQTVVDLLRVLPMPVAELLDDWFECDALKVALGATGLLHLRQGPRSGGTAFTMLHHCVGSPPGVFHPPITNLGWALLNLHDRPTLEIRRGPRVERINVRGGRVSGVTLADGTELEAPIVVSSADAKRTLLTLLEPGWLDPEFARAVGNIKSRGTAARVTLHLSRKPDFPTLVFASSLDRIERAYDAAKYGRVSDRPYFQCHAEEDRAVAYVQYVPYDAPNLGDEALRRSLAELVEKQLAAAVPEIAGTITSSEVETPREREEKYGLTQGHAYQGELTLDQILFMRPVPGWSRYRMPIGGLFLCGAATHPGGSVAGGAGWLAAKEVLRGSR